MIDAPMSLRGLFLTACFLLTLSPSSTAFSQVSLSCETAYSSDSYGFIQMHQGAEQDYFFYKLTSSQIRVYQSPCAGTVLWEYTIPAQYQSATYRGVYAKDVTGDGISDLVFTFLLATRYTMLVVNPVNDSVLLTLDDATNSYSLAGFADVDNDDLGELLISATNNSTFQFKYQVWNTNGSTGFESLPTPSDFNLAPAFPNPFNASVSIPFELERPGNVEVRIFNILGNQVAQLAQPNVMPGTNKINWDASRLPSGSYFYSVLLNGAEVGNQRVILLR